MSFIDNVMADSLVLLSRNSGRLRDQFNGIDSGQFSHVVGCSCFSSSISLSEGELSKFIVKFYCESLACMESGILEYPYPATMITSIVYSRAFFIADVAEEMV